MRTYNASGILISRGSYNRDILTFTNTASGVPATHDVLWDTCPDTIGATALGTTTITASGLRTSIFLTPPRKTELYAVGVRVTANLIGVPTASGMFGLYENISDTLKGDINTNFYPSALLWQSEPFVCNTTGIYIRYPRIRLERNSPYWLAWLGTRNTTMYTPGNGAILSHGHNFNANVGFFGLNVAINPVTDIMSANYPAGATSQIANQPLFFYQLIDI